MKVGVVSVSRDCFPAELAAKRRTLTSLSPDRVLERGYSITTIKGRAADIFHVRDESGRKITDEERVQTIRKALLKAAQPC